MISGAFDAIDCRFAMTTLGKLHPSRDFGGYIDLGHGLKTLGLREDFKQHGSVTGGESKHLRSSHTH